MCVIVISFQLTPNYKDGKSMVFVQTGTLILLPVRIFLYERIRSVDTMNLISPPPSLYLLIILN